MASGSADAPLFCPHAIRNSICFFCNRIPIEKRSLVRDNVSTFNAEQGEVIFREGDEAAGLWSVCSGRIHLQRISEEGRALVTRIIYPGGMMGHRSVLSGSVLMSTAVAHGPTVGTFLTRTVLEHLFATEPSFRIAIMRLLAEDLDHAEALAASMAYNDARSRVLAALAEFRRVRERMVGTLAGWEFSIRRKELSELTGLSVEGVVRTLKKLEADGVLEIRGRTIRIVDPYAVRQQCLHHCTERQTDRGADTCHCLFERSGSE